MGALKAQLRDDVARQRNQFARRVMKIVEGRKAANEKE